MCKLVQVDWPNQYSHNRNVILSRRVVAILVKELQSEIHLLVYTMYEVTYLLSMAEITSGSSFEPNNLTEQELGHV